MTLAALHQALTLSAESKRRAPLKWIRWLPVQYRYFVSQSVCRLLRAGNQNLGKTTVGLGDLYLCATGEHPHRECSKSGEYWVICASWSQSVAIQKKLWELVERDRVHPETEFSQKNGFRGQNPACQVRHEDGSYSIIRFKTTRQGTLDLASATIRGALFDEPPTSKDVFTEVLMRCTKLGGWVSITMTPVGAPVGWIKEMVEAGQIEDIHTRLTPEALIPVGASEPLRLEDGRLCDIVYIREQEAKVPEHERDVRVHGGWEIRTTGRYFSVFRSSGADAHVHENAPTGQVYIIGAMDHGTLPGKQIGGVLFATQNGRYWDVYLRAEYVDWQGTATTDDDADGFLAMLASLDLSWHDLDWFNGDRVHMKGTKSQKSNADFMIAIAERLECTVDELHPKVRTVKHGEGSMKGSVAVGCRWLFQQMVRPGGFGVHPDCVRTIEAIDNHLPSFKDDGSKDPIDMIRYGCDDLIFKRENSPGPTVRWG